MTANRPFVAVRQDTARDAHTRRPMDEFELIKIGAFKLGDAARRMDALARAAQTTRVVRLMTALSRRLAAEKEELLDSLEVATASAPRGKRSAA